MIIANRKGLRSDISYCASSLSDSDLGRHYFPSEESATNAILEFVDSDSFLVVSEFNGKAQCF